MAISSGTTVIHRRQRASKLMEYVLNLYRAEHPDQPDEPHQIAPWALKRGLYKKAPMTAEEMLRRELSTHLKNTYIIDPQGREVRANHAVFIEVQTPQGPKRRSRWLPLFEAPPEHMLVSAQLRRRQALADVMQLTLDLESYNENNVHGVAIPMPDCDFNKDIEESKQPAIYPSGPSEDEDEEI